LELLSLFSSLFPAISFEDWSPLTSSFLSLVLLVITGASVVKTGAVTEAAAITALLF